MHDAICMATFEGAKKVGVDIVYLQKSYVGWEGAASPSL